MPSIYMIFAATQLAIFYYQQHCAASSGAASQLHVACASPSLNHPQPTIRIYTVSRQLHHHHNHSHAELHGYERIHYDALLRYDSLLTEHHPPYRRIYIRYP